jgi:hypothetical protein
MKCAAVALAASALAIPAAASARTLRLDWAESTSFGYPAMTFTVKSVTIHRGSWSVLASVTNRSRGDIGVVTEPSPYLPYRFGLLVPSAHLRNGLPETLSHDTTWRAALSFAPRLPVVLPPRATWRGTFSGRGALPRGRPIGVTFGVFASRQLGSFSWATDHAFTL